MIKAGDLVKIWHPKRDDSFLIRMEPGYSFGTHFAQIKHDDIIGKKYGSVYKTAGGDVYLLRPCIAHYTRSIKRRTQVVFPKDAGFILLNLNIVPGSRVVECGTGSGGLCCIFATYVGDTGKVYTYDRREEFSELARKNAKKWGVDHRIEFNVRDLEEGFKEREADAVFLDVPNPWDYIETARDALASGNRIGILIPTVNQLVKTMEKLEHCDFVEPETVEIIMRHFKTDYSRMRPQDHMVGHTAYLLFATKTEVSYHNEEGNELDNESNTVGE